MADLLDLTVVLPVKNEEVNLPACLACIGKDWAEKIVVVDSGSSDGTKKIAGSFGAEVIDFAWNGRFPKKRNWYLNNYPPSTKWVLFLDADEFITEEFKEEVREKLKKEEMAGYWLHYSVYFLGQKLKGGYPLRKLALFQVHAGSYERVEEDYWSQLDMEVHEHPIIKGELGAIKSKIDHKDYQGFAHYITKHNEYASWEAARFLKAKRNTDVARLWTWKQRLKYWLMQGPLIGPAYFIGSFFFWGGFRDGARGLAFAILKMGYFTQVYCKVKEGANKNYTT